MRDLLTQDNYELFDIVRNRLNAKPVEPIDCIARDIGVTVDELCRWVLSFSEKKRHAKPYQSPRFPAIALPQRDGDGSGWNQDNNIRRMKAWKKAHEGAAVRRRELGYNE